MTRRALPSLVTSRWRHFRRSRSWLPIMPMSACKNSSRRAFLSSLNHEGHVGGMSLLQFFGKIFGHLFLAKVDGRHNHVGRPMTRKGNNPFATVGFFDMNAGGFQIVVEVDFLRSHGFGFDDPFNVFFLTQVEEIFFQCGAVFGAEDLGATFDGFGFKFVGNCIDVGDSGSFHIAQRITQGFDIFNIFIALARALDRLRQNARGHRAALYV